MLNVIHRISEIQRTVCASLPLNTVWRTQDGLHLLRKIRERFGAIMNLKMFAFFFLVRHLAPLITSHITHHSHFVPFHHDDEP